MVSIPGGQDRAGARQFPRTDDRFKTQKIPAFTLHDLRRTCRTGLARMKVEPHIAERVLNYAQPGIASVYDGWTYIDKKRTALQKWAEHLKGLMP